MEGRLPRRFATIQHTDVACYSRLASEDEDSPHHSLSECPAGLEPQARCVELDLSDGFSNQLSL